MVHTHEAPKKSRQRIAAEGMSKVQKLHRAIQSGQLKPELRTASEAVLAARMVQTQIEKSGIYDGSEDFHVRIAYLTPDLAALGTLPFTPGKEAEISASLSEHCTYMVGIVFALWDDEHKNWIVGARQFVSTERVNRLFDNWLTTMFLSNAPPNA
jgi:hypothetical protein